MTGPAAHIHHCFAQPGTAPHLACPPDIGQTEPIERRLRQLRQRIATAVQSGAAIDEATWRVRSYPVLAVLAPVITTPDNELAYPGDPMCLYSAVALSVQRAAQARVSGIGADLPYPDLCPDWGLPPSKAYRLAAPENGLRLTVEGPHTSDASTYDPRIWTPETRAQFVRVLRLRRPRILLISTVSAGHRYALEMAKLAKEELPHCLVVVGGRHIDETVRYNHSADQVQFAYSSTVAAIHDGRVPPVVDFLVSGDGPFALDLLLRAISRATPIESGSATTRQTVAVLHELGTAGERPKGTAVIVALDGPSVHAFPILGSAYSLAELPSPYSAFAIRARFPIFPRPGDGKPRRTAHIMTSTSCPYRCTFCSESVMVTGVRRLRPLDVASTLERLCEYIHYGAEACFFDDPVFWSGNVAAIQAFCELLASARRTRGNSLPATCQRWMQAPDDLERLASLEWGAQFTVDLLTTVHKQHTVERMLSLARQAGCTYIYVGLESMSAQVMAPIHKNLHKQDGPSWAKKVRTALGRIKAADIRTGASVLFGIDGETRDTIAETVEEVGRLIDDGLLDLASPNILTYHPAAEITFRHGMQDTIDYHSMGLENRPPYCYFEEAYPGVVSRLLTEEDVWYIHKLTSWRWGTRRNGAELDSLATTDPPTVNQLAGISAAGAHEVEHPYV